MPSTRPLAIRHYVNNGSTSSASPSPYGGPGAPHWQDGGRYMWSALNYDGRRAIILSLVDGIEVGKATNLGSHNFDPARVKVAYRTAAIQKLVHLYQGADGGWRIPSILFSTDPKQPLPETISRRRILTPDEIEKMKKKGRPVPKSQAS